MEDPRNRTTLQYKVTLLIADETNNKSYKNQLLEEIQNRLDSNLQFNSKMIPRFFKAQDRLNQLIQTTITKLNPILVNHEGDWDTSNIHILRQIQLKAYLCIDLVDEITSKLQESSIITLKIKKSMSNPELLELPPTITYYNPTKLKTIIKVSFLKRIHKPESEILFDQLKKETEASRLAGVKFKILKTTMIIITHLIQSPFSGIDRINQE